MELPNMSWIPFVIKKINHLHKISNNISTCVREEVNVNQKSKVLSTLCSDFTTDVTECCSLTTDRNHLTSFGVNAYKEATVFLNSTKTGASTMCEM